VASSPGEQAIEAALKPLEFAARNDFAHLERVRDLEAAVASAAERGLELSIPRDLTAALRAVREAFAKRPVAESLRGEIERALKRLQPFAEPDYAERALATTPQPR
jgi:hypothetical protein